MKVQNIALVAAVLVGALLAMSGVRAISTDGTNVNFVGNVTSTGSSPTTMTAYGGEVTPMNVSQVTNSNNWNAFVGNITQSLVLEGTSGTSIYNWSGSVAPNGWIIFSNSSSFDFATAAFATNAGTAVGEDNYLSLGVTPDNVSSTFSSAAGNPAIVLDSSTVGADSTINITTNSLGGTDWGEYLIVDGNADVAYVGDINNNNEDYKGDPVDYQVIVPVNSGTNRVYYVYAAVTAA
ncbi:MAG: hypothetical protein H6502_03350 [Candidatus Woesearchaeota archaeon]|nr:MAG: hypothetical protein H6502_03350 [Candidatus Woesearchaeota archaeon]